MFIYTVEALIRVQQVVLNTFLSSDTFFSIYRAIRPLNVPPKKNHSIQ